MLTVLHLLYFWIHSFPLSLPNCALEVDFEGHVTKLSLMAGLVVGFGKPGLRDQKRERERSLRMCLSSFFLASFLHVNSFCPGHQYHSLLPLRILSALILVNWFHAFYPWQASHPLYVPSLNPDFNGVGIFLSCASLHLNHLWENSVSHWNLHW